MIVLCLGCGMKVVLLADGGCPSCGAHGQVGAHVWHGKRIDVLTPSRLEDGHSAERYACLYLRPFAGRFRAAGRLQAVAQAMAPFGTTVALYADEARLGLRPVPVNPAVARVLRVLSYIPRLGLAVFVFVALPLLAWKAVIRLVEIVERWVFRFHSIELVEVQDERWHQTFRRLAFHSRVIVMDVSTMSPSLAYEAEFITDLELAARLVILHKETLSARTSAERQVARLHSAGLDVPLVPYSTWRMHRLTKDLRQVMARRGPPVS